MAKKLLITNVAYGKEYTDLFLNQHLKSMLDDSNILAVKNRIEYMIFTDRSTKNEIRRHPNFKRLRRMVPTQLSLFRWPEDKIWFPRLRTFKKIDRFEARYSVLINTFKLAVKIAISRDRLLSAWVADLVVAKDFLPKILKPIDDGHGAVFMLPLRSAAEKMVPELSKFPGALEANHLCKLGYKYLHPLWGACHWNAAQFTELPMSLLWNSGTGLMARSFSITPIVFQPTAKMINSRGMIDGDIPELCKNPYWATDWTDAPVIGVEPLRCYYPPWLNHTATTRYVRTWGKCLYESQFQYLKKPLYYPSQAAVKLDPEILNSSAQVVNEILKGPLS